MTFTRLAGIVCVAVCLVPRGSEAQLAPLNEAGITTVSGGGYSEERLVFGAPQAETTTSSRR